MTWISMRWTHRCTRFARGRSGFTLVEALISLAIAAVAISALVRCSGQAVNTQIKIEAYTAAISLAETKLADVRLDGPSLYVDESGEFDAPWERFTWRVTAVEISDVPGLHSVQLTIDLPDRGTYTTTTFMYEETLSVIAQE